jgi:hypothetical protein
MVERDPNAWDTYESRLSPLEKRIRRILGFVVGWLVLVAISWLYVMPYVRSSVPDWIALIVFGPPAYLLAESVGESLFAPWRGSTRAERITRVVVLALEQSSLALFCSIKRPA